MPPRTADDEGIIFISNKQLEIEIRFESVGKNVVVSIGANHFVKIDEIDQLDFEDISDEMCDIHPHIINDLIINGLGAPISSIEKFIFAGFLTGNNNVDKLNNSIITVDHEFNIKLQLSCGKIFVFPKKPDYFDFDVILAESQ